MALGPLQNNGSPTQTRALRSDSLAIDAGDQGNGVPKLARPRLLCTCGPISPWFLSWQCEVVDDGGRELSSHDIGQYASLALEPDTGRVYIAYYEATSGDLRVALQMWQVFEAVVVR